MVDFKKLLKDHKKPHQWTSRDLRCRNCGQYQNKHSEACPGIKPISIKAERRSCFDDFKTRIEVNIEATFIWSMASWWVQLIGGPTGYESCSVNRMKQLIWHENLEGWCACAGTKNRWDLLWVPKTSCAQILSHFRSLNLK